MQDGEVLANEEEVSADCMGFADISEKEIWIFVPKKWDIIDLKQTISHEIGHIIELKYPSNLSTDEENDELHEEKADYYMNFYMLVDEVVGKTLEFLK